MDNRFDRRELLQKLGKAGIALAGIELLSTTALYSTAQPVEAAPAKTTIVVASGKNVPRMVTNAINKLGGIRKFVKPGAKVVIKPNIAWARTPEQAANTNPQVVDTIIKLCKSAGAGSVSIHENTCDNASITFKTSGIAEVCKQNGIELVAANRSSHYRAVSIPRGKTLKSVNAVKAIMDADCYINVPVAKVHSSGVVTLSLKNQMGCVEDRGVWHATGLHQCIADCATVMHPDLVVLDATRMLMTRGPAGPGKVQVEDKIVAGTDMVAIDAYGARLLRIDPKNVGHIVKAAQFGLGTMDFSNISIVNV